MRFPLFRQFEKSESFGSNVRNLTEYLLQSIQKFRENVSVGSWFSCIKDASMEFQPDKRIAWVEGDLLDVDDQEDSCFHSKRLCVHTKVVRSISKEFKIIHRGKIYWIRANEAPDWVPEFNDDVKEELDDDINSNDDGPLEHVLESGGRILMTKGIR
ncbi:hypothetical protein Tco_0045539 [Tanacetum coccineum]